MQSKADEIFSEADYAEWTTRLREKDSEFASKIKKLRPDLKIKQMLDGRRREMRYAISVRSTAKLLGIDQRTLKKILEDQFQFELEPFQPLAGSGHRYLWLEDVLEYSKKMSR